LFGKSIALIVEFSFDDVLDSVEIFIKAVTVFDMNNFTNPDVVLVNQKVLLV